mmetsp:Transcript_13575/g.26765  ORF Transcript_13575/g.26765 Transcript_13575/m.26765 type:complete len:680 (+) Transcript_13575:43-2082(+)
MAAVDIAAMPKFRYHPYPSIEKIEAYLRDCIDPMPFLLSRNHVNFTPLHCIAKDSFQVAEELGPDGPRRYATLFLEAAGDNYAKVLGEKVSGRSACQLAVGNADFQDWLLSYHTFKFPSPMPLPKELVQQEAHLTLGISAGGVSDLMEYLEFPDKYERNQDKLGWVTGDVIGGYDLCERIKDFGKEHGYTDFSMVEVMMGIQHPSVGRADWFFSHAQSEAITDTVEAMRRFAALLGQIIFYFLDYASLRQLIKDFSLPEVQTAIATIGHTVMMAQPSTHPVTLTRTFCAFELYASCNSECDFAIVTSTNDAQLLDEQLTFNFIFHPGDIEVVKKRALELGQPVDVENADCRDPKSKTMIDDFIKEGPGFAKLNCMVRDAMLWGRVQLAYVSDHREGGDIYGGNTKATLKEPGHIVIEIILGLLEQTSVPAAMIEQTLCAAGGAEGVPMFKRFVSSCNYSMKGQSCYRSSEDLKRLFYTCEQKGVNVSKLILAEDLKGECSMSVCKYWAACNDEMHQWAVDFLSMFEPYAGSWQPRTDPEVPSFIGPGEEILDTFSGVQFAEAKIEAIDRGVHKFKFYVCTMLKSKSGTGGFGITASTDRWSMGKDGYIRGKQLQSLKDGAEVLMVVDMDAHTLTVAVNDDEGVIVEDKLPSSVVPFAVGEYEKDKIILTRVMATGGHPD